MCFEKIDFAKSKMWPNLKSLILSNILVLVAGIEIAKSSAEEFNGWTEMVSPGEVVAIVTSSAGCTNTHQTSVFSNMLPCVPRPTLLPITNPSKEANSSNDRSVIHLMPSYVSVDQCTGSCLGSPRPGAHECQPSATENVTFQVMAIQTTFSSGRWDTVCTTATVERHLACQCACKQKQEHCNPKIHIYDAPSCSCQCLEQAGRVSCGAGKKWDPHTCSCMCPRMGWRSCSTGYTYDSHDSCSCVRTYSLASGGLTFIVAFVVAFCIVTWFVVLHFKKRHTGHRRLRSDSNIERLLREAFNSESNVSTNVRGTNDVMRMTSVETSPTTNAQR